MAKVQAVTLYELRHTYASTMVRNGAPLIIVAQVAVKGRWAMVKSVQSLPSR